MRKLLLAALTLLAVTAAPASARPGRTDRIDPDRHIAAAAVTDYACSSWELEGAWGDGSVMESKTCLQWNGGNQSRVKSEFRARRGGVALSGTDWDADAADDARAWDRAIFDVYDPNNVAHGPSSSGGDIFNASYVVRYSNWYCFGGGQQETVYGVGWDIRATPPGLSRSGYKAGQSNNATTFLATC